MGARTRVFTFEVERKRPAYRPRQAGRVKGKETAGRNKTAAESDSISGPTGRMIAESDRRVYGKLENWKEWARGREVDFHPRPTKCSHHGARIPHASAKRFIAGLDLFSSGREDYCSEKVLVPSPGTPGEG